MLENQTRGALPPKPVLRENSVDWVRRSLAVELGAETPDLETRAENLVAIAEHFHILIEDLLRWVHCSTPGKEWSAAEFREFGLMMTSARRETSAIETESVKHGS